MPGVIKRKVSKTTPVCIHCGAVKSKFEKFYPNAHWFSAREISLKNRPANRRKLCYDCWMQLSHGNNRVLKALYDACMEGKEFDYNNPQNWKRRRR